MLIAGNIDGRKKNPAIFSIEAWPQSPHAQAKVHSADYPSLQIIAKEFLAKTKMFGTSRKKRLRRPCRTEFFLA